MKDEKIYQENQRKLKERMKKLLRQPPPTLEEVKKQWAASIEFSKKMKQI